jgi:hypothetical protein
VSSTGYVVKNRGLEGSARRGGGRLTRLDRTYEFVGGIGYALRDLRGSGLLRVGGNPLLDLVRYGLASEETCVR